LTYDTYKINGNDLNMESAAFSLQTNE